jgi:serine/threonine-protein kinase
MEQAGTGVENGASKDKPEVVVFDKFVIIDCLGVGATSTVYLVSEVGKPDVRLALKVLHPGIIDNVTAAKRFQRELLAAYKISDINVIRAFEFLRKGSKVAYTMEYAPGGSLRKIIDSGQLPNIEQITRFATQFASGLAAIHSSGVVHRNLRPANILIGEGEQIKIADFGIARLMNSRTITRKGEILGSIEYSSPEYINLGRFDRRADIYSFGLIIYELLVGPRSVAPRAPLEILRTQVNEKLSLPSELRMDCPPIFDHLVERACKPNPDSRFQSGEEILDFFYQYDEGSRPHVAAVSAVHVAIPRQDLEEEKKKWNSRLWSGMGDKKSWHALAILAGVSLGLTFCLFKFLLTG